MKFDVLAMALMRPNHLNFVASLWIIMGQVSMYVHVGKYPETLASTVLRMYNISLIG